MFYWLLKPFVFIFFRVFYKYDYRGRKNIPADKAVVFAPNHVNAFIDPIALGLLSDRRIRFFARGDVFKGAFAKRMLEALSISPMYRIQEGFSEIKKNDKTFEECRTRLTNNEAILLFPEAICVQERRLRPLKKGLARIVFQTEETMDFKKDVLIIPVGLNYTAAHKFRSKLFIDIGVPISVKEYEERYKQDKVRAINEFTKDFEKKLAEHMVVLDKTENDQLFLNLEEIYMHQWLKDEELDQKSLLNSYEGSRELAEMINFIDRTDPELINSLRVKSSRYIKTIHENGLRDHLLRPENIGNTFILQYLLMIIAMPLYGFGLLLNYPPYFFAKKFCEKKIKNVEFFASVYANLAMILWLLYAGIQILVIALVFHSWILLCVYAIIILPLTGAFTLWFYPIKQKIVGRARLLNLVRKKRDLVKGMVNDRFEIITEIEYARTAYNNYYSKS